MIALALFLIHYMVGLAYERHQYAVTAYNRTLRTGCTATCRSRGWETKQYKTAYCSCGYLRGMHTWQMLLLAAVWPAHFIVSSSSGYLVSGTYEPKEVKVARIQRETKELEAKMEARTVALEIAAGIRKEDA